MVVGRTVRRGRQERQAAGRRGWGESRATHLCSAERTSACARAAPADVDAFCSISTRSASARSLCARSSESCSAPAIERRSRASIARALRSASAFILLRSSTRASVLVGADVMPFVKVAAPQTPSGISASHDEGRGDRLVRFEPHGAAGRPRAGGQSGRRCDPSARPVLSIARDAGREWWALVRWKMYPDRA